MPSQRAPLTLRLGELEPAVNARGDSAGLTVKRDLQRYYGLIEANIPPLAISDWTSILDATAGKQIDPLFIWAAIVKAGHPALGERIRLMPDVQQIALADAVERAGRLAEYGSHSVEEALRQVTGLP